MKNLYPNIDFEIGGVIEDETKEWILIWFRFFKTVRLAKK
jgi:hypothetical protein